MKLREDDEVTLRLVVLEEYANGDVKLDGRGVRVGIKTDKPYLVIPRSRVDEVLSLKLKVGDRVRQKKSFDNKTGTILAISNKKAWVRMESPTINEPRTWRLDSMERAE